MLNVSASRSSRANLASMRKGPASFGALVVDMRYDPSHSVSLQRRQHHVDRLACVALPLVLAADHPNEFSAFVFRCASHGCLNVTGGGPGCV